MDEVDRQVRQFGDVAADECAVRIKPAGGLDNIDGTSAGISGGGLPVAHVQRGVEIGLLLGKPNNAVFGRLMQDAAQKFCRQGAQGGMQPAARFQAAHGGIDERETCFPLPPAFRQVV